MRVRIVPFASTYSRDYPPDFAQILCASCSHLHSIKFKEFLSLYHKLSKMMISCHQALYARSIRNDLTKPHALPKFSLRTYLCLHNTAIAVAGAEAMARKDLGSTARWALLGRDPEVLVCNGRSCLLSWLVEPVYATSFSDHFVFWRECPLFERAVRQSWMKLYISCNKGLMVLVMGSLFWEINGAKYTVSYERKSGAGWFWWFAAKIWQVLCGKIWARMGSLVT